MFNWKKVNKTIKNGVKRIVGGYLANSIKKTLHVNHIYLVNLICHQCYRLF